MVRTKVCLMIAAGSALALAQVAWAGPWRRGQSQPQGWNRVIHAGTFGGATDSFPFCENFDSYAAGPWPCAAPAPLCTGPNGFALWGTSETSSLGTPGPNNGTISTAQAHSPPKSLLFAPAVDIVQTGNITSGQWSLKVWTYVPSGSGGASDVAYIIVMNAYNPPTFVGNNWSIQFTMNKSTGMIVNANTNTPAVPLIRDQWVLAEAIIDLSTDTATLNYNGALAYTQPYSSGYAAGGLVAIACIDLFSDDATGVFYDDVSLSPVGGPTCPPAPCYANCDNSTVAPCLNVQDFSCFLNAFANGNTYANCDASTIAPILNVQDFSCFLNKFANGCSSC